MKGILLLWFFTGLIISIGLIPYKFPVVFDSHPGNDVILVSHAECTCCGDFEIECGTLRVPEHLQNQLKNPFYELNVIQKNSPFDKVTDENFVITLYHNQFILYGKIVGIDSFCGENRPIVKVSGWSPVYYRPVFLTSGHTWFLLYLTLSVLLLILSTTVTLIKRKSHSGQ